MNLLYREPEWARPAVGGLLVGLGLVAVPAMYGEVTTTLHRVLTGQFDAAMIALLLVMQIVLAALVIAMGGSGGVFGPTLFVGASTGAVLASAFAPFAASSLTTFAVIGMGTAFAAAREDGIDPDRPVTDIVLPREAPGATRASQQRRDRVGSGSWRARSGGDCGR